MKIRTFEINREGRLMERKVEGQLEDMKHTLLEALYPGIQLARVQVPVEPLDSIEQALAEQALGNLKLEGVPYRLVGASGSAKSGRFYAVPQSYEKQLSGRFQNWPEAAVSYFGILTSECRHGVLRAAHLRVLVVKDNELGTNDCRGWISQALFSSIKSPDGESLPAGRFYQFRMGFDAVNAKGSFKVMDNEVAKLLQADVVLPDSCLKPALKDRNLLQRLVSPEGRRFQGPAVVGIREISRELEFSSSYTLLVHAPEESVQCEILPRAMAEARKVTQAVTEGNYEALLTLLGSSEAQQELPRSSDPREDERLDFTSCELQSINAYLKADGQGLMMKFKPLIERLKRLLARWTFKLTTAGGFKLPGFALADDGFLFAHQGKVVSGSDWIPKDAATASLPSKKGLVVRYPIRMREDLLPVNLLSAGEVMALLAQELQRQGIQMGTLEARSLVELVESQLQLPGTLTLHSQTAKLNGGDFDFDYVSVVEDCQFPRWVESRFSNPGRPAQQKAKLAKVKSFWWNLPSVAMSVRGNEIGSITDLITSCLAVGKEDLAYELVEQLQCALDSLKHGVKVNTERIAEIRRQVNPAPWLALKQVKTVSEMPLHFAVSEHDKVGRLYNLVRKEVHDLFAEQLPLSAYRNLISGHHCTREMLEETRGIYLSYAVQVSEVIKQKEQLQLELAKAQQAWDAVKELGPEHRDQKRQVAFKRRQARAAFLHFEKVTARKEFGNAVVLVKKWAVGKMQDRPAWAQALLHVVCGVKDSKATGAILLHAFPQEMVDALVEKTGGRPVLVTVPQLPDGAVSVELAEADQCCRIFMTHGEEKTLLIEITAEGDVVMDGRRIKSIKAFPLKSGNGELRDGRVVFAGIPQHPKITPFKSNGAVA